MQSESRITQQELASLFPDGVPMPLMKMIFPEKSEKLTVEDIRYILNAMRSEAALSTDAEPVKTAPAVAVKALRWRKYGNQHGTGWQGIGAIGYLQYIVDRSPDGEEGWFWGKRGFDTEDEAKAAVQAHYDAAILSALSAQVQDVAGLERLRDVTYAVQHNPNCPAKYLVRLVGKSGHIDLKPYGNGLPRVKHETGDILGFGKTLGEAIDNALAASTASKHGDEE